MHVSRLLTAIACTPSGELAPCKTQLLAAAAKQGDFGLYWAACRMHGLTIEVGSGSQVLQETAGSMLAACSFLLLLPLLRNTAASGKLKNLAPAPFSMLWVWTHAYLKS